MKVLIIEDDKDTREYIARGFGDRGHSVELASDGEDGLRLARAGGHDVLILDRMLPKLDGLSVLKELRGAGVQTPTLFLTALGDLEDRVQGLEQGGDDYLIKPFAFAELYARASSLARRPPVSSEQITQLACGDLKVNLLYRTVFRGSTRIELMPTEFRLLEYLMRNAGKTVTRTMLLENVWGFHFDPKSSIVETHISRLRAKVDRDFDQELITTVRGAGYSLHV